MPKRNKTRAATAGRKFKHREEKQQEMIDALNKALTRLGDPPKKFRPNFSFGKNNEERKTD